MVGGIAVKASVTRPLLLLSTSPSVMSMSAGSIDQRIAILAVVEAMQR